MTSAIIKAHLQMLGFTIFLGGSFIASANISNSLSPMIITWLRYAIASLLFIPLLKYQGLLKLPGYRDLGRYTLVSLPPLLYFICMIFALQKTSALDSSALYTIVPLMSAIMSLILLRIRSSALVIFALLLGMLGALLIIFKGDLAKVMQLSFTPSNWLFLLGCLGMALNPIAVKKLHRNEPAIVLTSWSLICATLLLTLMVAHQLPEISWHHITLSTWSGILYLAVFATAFSFFLFQKACLVLSATQVSGYVYLIPISVVVTNLILGQPQNWSGISAGIVLVLITMIILVRSKK